MTKLDKTLKSTQALYGLILGELMEYDRFNSFIQMNYQIHTIPNAEEGRIEVKVIEEDAEHVRQKIQEAISETLAESEKSIEIATATALDSLKKN